MFLFSSTLQLDGIQADSTISQLVWLLKPIKFEALDSHAIQSLLPLPAPLLCCSMRVLKCRGLLSLVLGVWGTVWCHLSPVVTPPCVSGAWGRSSGCRWHPQPGSGVQPAPQAVATAGVAVVLVHSNPYHLVQETNKCCTWSRWGFTSAGYSLGITRSGCFLGFPSAGYSLEIPKFWVFPGNSQVLGTPWGCPTSGLSDIWSHSSDLTSTVT